VAVNVAKEVTKCSNRGCKYCHSYGAIVQQ